MKFVYFKMFSEVLRNRRQVLYMWESAWCDSVFFIGPPFTTWLLYVVKSLNLFKLLHNIFMFIIFVFSGENEAEAAQQNKFLTQVLCCT